MGSTLNTINTSKTLYKLSSIQLLQSFSFYGMRSLLVLYFTQSFLLPDSQALTLYGNTMAFLYIAPLIGGLLIDKYWTSSMNLLAGVIVSSFGLLIICLPYQDTFLYGLSILIVGQGLFKPTIPYLLDKSYVASDQRRDSGYTFYYVMINIGATLAPFLCGFIKQSYGWQISFTLCFLSSVLGLVLAALYVKKNSSLAFSWKEGALFVLGCIVSSILICYFLNFPQWMDTLILFMTPLIGGFLIYVYVSSKNKQDTALMLLAILLFCLFAALFEQAGGSVTLFIEKHINRTVGNFENLPSSLFLGLNPFFTIVIGLWLSRVLNLSSNFPTLRLLALGFACIGIGFSLLWLSASFVTESFTNPSLWWVVGAFLFHSLGELCIVPITLSLATRFAPQDKKGVAIGLWYLAAAYGHYLAAWLSKSVLQKGNYSTLPISSVTSFAQVFTLTTQIALISTIVLVFLSLALKRKE